MFEKQPFVSLCNAPVLHPAKPDVVAHSVTHISGKIRPFCDDCKKCSHVAANCFLLNRNDASSRAVMVVTTPAASVSCVEGKVDVRNYSHFLMKGTVYVGGVEVSVTILRDTAAFWSIMFSNILPLSVETPSRSNELVPLHRIHLNSALVSGDVAVAVYPFLPIKGFDLIMGNDMAGGKILVTPEVTMVPVGFFFFSKELSGAEPDTGGQPEALTQSSFENSDNLNKIHSSNVRMPCFKRQRKKTKTRH